MMRFSKKIITYKKILFLLAGITLVSCKSNYAILTIENIQHAKEELSPDIQSITLMNRSMSGQFQNHREDSLQMYFYRKGFQLSNIVLDSAAADTTIRALAALMFESGRYDVVVPLERNFKRSLSYEILPDTLSPAQVSEICTNFKTDALMVLELFTTKTMADYSAERYLDGTTGNIYSYNATLDLKYNAFFRVYKPGIKTLVKEIALSDTIYWESVDNSQEGLFRKLPTVKQALINAGIKVALDVDSKLSPTWIPEKRGYFLFKNKDDQGQKFMNENKYDEAGQYWTEMSRSTNKKTRSKAEYNLALISELNGDMDKAIEFGLKSFYSFYRFQTQTYLKKLEARKIELQKSE
jgi:hypothetical protein